jgi:hypothetical protein
MANHHRWVSKELVQEILLHDPRFLKVIAE